jgi:hypothetical protein
MAADRQRRGSQVPEPEGTKVGTPPSVMSASCPRYTAGELTLCAADDGADQHRAQQDCQDGPMDNASAREAEPQKERGLAEEQDHRGRFFARHEEIREGTQDIECGGQGEYPWSD